MIAIDTNVIVRLVTADEPVQARRAASLIQRERHVFVPATVLVEAEWVLRSAYALRDDVINDAFRKLLSLEQVETERPAAVLQGLDLHAEGMDFADAMHLTLSSDATRFATFDRKLRSQAKQTQTRGIPTVVEP